VADELAAGKRSYRIQNENRYLSCDTNYQRFTDLQVLLLNSKEDEWWSQTGSNRRPLACHLGVLI
jgi:hypothetical protein